MANGIALTMIFLLALQSIAQVALTSSKERLFTSTNLQCLLEELRIQKFYMANERRGTPYPQTMVAEPAPPI
ncbi:hypothetical protein MFRU_059g00020 [Monilinia fructicola]|nr:hypothetical protein MFRU_059g00020 [Monilinia fructicola]